MDSKRDASDSSETESSPSSMTTELAATSQIRDKVATLEPVSKLVEPGLISTL